MTGKEKCEILRKIRSEIAKQNSIDLQMEKCSNQGECLGTCPKCEAEVYILEKELKQRQRGGSEIKLKNIAAGIVQTKEEKTSQTETNKAFEKEEIQLGVEVLPDDPLMGIPMPPKRELMGTLMRPEREFLGIPIPTKATIAVLIREKSGEIFQMKKSEMSIGRNKDQADYVIDNKMISRHHADISVIEGLFYLKDNDSTHGTFYHGEKLGAEPKELRELDEFVLEKEKFIFAFGESMRDIFNRQDSGPFAVLTAVETGEMRLVKEGGLVLNRNHPWENGVLMDKYISRNDHAQILSKEKGFYLQDLHSTNGTSLNGKRLEKGEERELTDGDEIKIVDTPFIFSVFSLDPKEKEKE